MSDMTGPNGASDPGPAPGGSMRRRDFLATAAAAGAVAWTAPLILSQPAYAADGGGGTPQCRPTIQPRCLVHDCDQGSKHFPGFTVDVSNCLCPPRTQRPVTCIKITNIGGNCSPDVTAYGNATDCSPRQSSHHTGAPDDILSTGDWECFRPQFPVFFGRRRSGMGAIPNLPSCTLTFRLGVWAGLCPDRDSSDDAFTCRTYDVTIQWDSSGDGTATCTFTPAAPANSLCTNMPADQPPAGCLPCTP